MKALHSMGHVVGGSLLVAATTIGVGMLALPVVTGAAGFLPTVVIYALSWLFMLCTGLLLLEVNLWLPKDTSFISMAASILGPIGKVVFWVVYLFLFIIVMVAHSAGGGSIIQELTGSALPHWLLTTLYTVVFIPIVYLGAKTVDRLNLFLIAGVGICYLSFVSVSLTSVDLKLLTHVDWGKSWIMLPILFAAFTYQVIVPTLMSYLKQNVRKIRLSIVFGSLIPFVVYLIWEFLVLGIVPPTGPGGLAEARMLGQNAVAPLKQFVQNPLIIQIGNYFAFFALTTSFVPFALSFFDFLADGLKWKKKGFPRLILCLAIFGVPLAIALKNPDIFLKALGYAGGISCALLFGLMPPLMVWVGRYIKRLPSSTKQLPGGKPFLIFLMFCASVILIAEVAQQFYKS